MELKNQVPEQVFTLKEKIEPLFGRVLIWPCDIQYTDKESILIRPDISQDAPETGVVVAVAQDCEAVDVGDVVLFGKYSGYGLADDLFLSIREEDVMNRLHNVKVEPRGEKGPARRAGEQGQQVISG